MDPCFFKDPSLISVVLGIQISLASTISASKISNDTQNIDKTETGKYEKTVGCNCFVRY